MTKFYRFSKGFTLVELSIVIIIIGFLIAGIATGMSLVKSAKLNKIISDSETYKAAFTAFYNRYGALPGDMKNATAFWGALAGSNCSATVPSGTATCNGNGDGFVQDGNYENLRAWQHLVNAGMVNGNFNGMSASTSDNWTSEIGVNIPAAPMNNAGYTFATYQGHANQGWVPLNRIHHDLYVGSKDGAGSGAWGRSFAPQDQYMIDAKIDDGMPGTGIVYANSDIWWSDGPCYADISQLESSTYNLSGNPAGACILNFVLPLTATW